eukprot:7388352-Prymnesium_polylepis.2
MAPHAGLAQRACNGTKPAANLAAFAMSRAERGSHLLAAYLSTCSFHSHARSSSSDRASIANERLGSVSIQSMRCAA